MHYVFHARRVEPKQRLVGGKFGWAIHRFEIKGGIPISAIIADNVTKNNALIRRMMEKT